LIFVTVGGQKPFDRLIECVDHWAADRVLPSDAVLAQIGKGATVPSYIESVLSLAPAEYRKCVERSRLIIAHAGMGLILTAVDASKPILVMPRIARYGEQARRHTRPSGRWTGSPKATSTPSFSSRGA